MDLIPAPLALLDVVKVAKAAKIRRQMKADDVAKLGRSMKKRMDTIEACFDVPEALSRWTKPGDGMAGATW